MTGHWIGLREANAALRRLPDFAKDPIQQTMDTTAFHVARRAELRAPRGATGILRESIRWQRRPRSLSAVVGVDSTAFYWKFLEYGTVHLEARPFFRPAAEAMAADHDRRMLQALEQALTRVEREAK